VGCDGSYFHYRYTAIAYANAATGRGQHTLNINSLVSADAARTYYAAGGYYRIGQAREFIGNWHGLGADRLGITGPLLGEGERVARLLRRRPRDP
jgi:hypothetical protein